jgi:hypothetical protein
MFLKPGSNQGVQMLITLCLVGFAFLFVAVIKILSRGGSWIIMRRLRQRKRLADLEKRKDTLLYQNEYYSSRLAKILLDKEAQNKRYTIQVLQKNICKIFGYYIQKKLKLFLITFASFAAAVVIIVMITTKRFRMIEERITRFFDKSNKDKSLEQIDKDSKVGNLTTIFDWDLCKMANDQFLEDYLLVIFSLSLTVFIYLWNSFKIRKSHKYLCKFSKVSIRKCRSNNTNEQSEDEVSREFIDTVETKSAASVDSVKTSAGAQRAQVKTCSKFCDRFIICFISFKKWLNLGRFKRFVVCGLDCNCGIDFPIPMNPFSKRNRFITGIIYAAYTYNILKIFEHMILGGDQTVSMIDHTKSVFRGLNGTNFTALTNANLSSAVRDGYKEVLEFAKQQERGILMDLLKQVCNVFIIGLRYYPVLLCAEVKRKSKLSYFLCTVYVASIFAYYLYMNTFCLLSAYTTIKDFQLSIKMDDNSSNK